MSAAAGAGAVEALLSRQIGPGPAADLMALCGGGPQAGLDLTGLPVELAPEEDPPTLTG